MSSETIIAILSFSGTVLGTLAGILASSRLTTFRIEQLEKKVDKHNTIIERTYILEGEMKEVKNDLSNITQNQKG